MRLSAIPAPRPPLPPVSAMVTQGQIESELMRLSALLETVTDQLARAMEEAAEADVRWKSAEAVALLVSEQMSAERRRAEALTKCKREYSEYRGSEAIKDGLIEKARTIRAQLESLRTLAANVRSQT